MKKIIKGFFFLAFGFALISTWSCNEVECSFEDDQKIITDYLSDNGLTAIKSESGLHYIIEEEGIGSLYPGFSSTVTVKYKGYFTDGTVFDENENGLRLGLNQFIIGFQEGMIHLKKEGRGTFLIPSSLGYGTRAVAGIDGRECSVILFDVELEDFQ